MHINLASSRRLTRQIDAVASGARGGRLGRLLARRDRTQRNPSTAPAWDTGAGTDEMKVVPVSSWSERKRPETASGPWLVAIV